MVDHCLVMSKSIIEHQAAEVQDKGDVASLDIVSEPMGQVMAVDPVNRDILLGFPIANGDVVIIRHCLTGQLLCLEPKLKQNDFGAERLVTARTVLDVRRKMNLEKVKQVCMSLICG